MNFSGVLAKEIKKRKKGAKKVKSGKDGEGDDKRQKLDLGSEIGGLKVEIGGGNDGAVAGTKDHANDATEHGKEVGNTTGGERSDHSTTVNTIDPKETRENKEIRYKLQHEREEAVEKDILLEDITNNTKDKLLLQLRVYIKSIVKHWEQTGEDLDLLFDTKKDLVILLYKLRSDGLTDDMVTSLSTICFHLQHSQFQKATQSYMKLSIGNIAYPIGVVDVGIHARSALSRIQTAGANIMIDDQTRRWITAIKRLITFSEKQSKSHK